MDSPIHSLTQLHTNGRITIPPPTLLRGDNKTCLWNTDTPQSKQSTKCLSTEQIAEIQDGGIAYQMHSLALTAYCSLISLKQVSCIYLQRFLTRIVSLEKPHHSYQIWMLYHKYFRFGRSFNEQIDGQVSFICLLTFAKAKGTKRTRCVCETLMLPEATKSKMAMFIIEVAVKTTDPVVNRKGYISTAWMPNMESVSLTAKFITDRPKTRCP